MVKPIRSSQLKDRFAHLRGRSQNYETFTATPSSDEEANSATSTSTTDLRDITIQNDTTAAAQVVQGLAAGGFAYHPSKRTGVVGLNDMQGAPNLFVQISPNRFGSGYKGADGWQIDAGTQSQKAGEFRDRAISRLRKLYPNKPVTILTLGEVGEDGAHGIAQEYEDGTSATWQQITEGASELQREDGVRVIHSSVKSHSEFFWGEDDLEMLLNLYDNTIAAGNPLSIHCTDGLDRAGAVSFGLILFHHRDKIFQADPNKAEAALQDLLQQARDDRSPGYCQHKAVGAAIGLASMLTAMQREKEAVQSLAQAPKTDVRPDTTAADLLRTKQSQQNRFVKRLPRFLRKRTKLGKEIDGLEKRVALAEAQAAKTDMQTTFIENFGGSSEERQRRADLRAAADGPVPSTSPPPSAAQTSGVYVPLPPRPSDTPPTGSNYAPLPPRPNSPPPTGSGYAPLPPRQSNTQATEPRKMSFSQELLNYFTELRDKPPQNDQSKQLFRAYYEVANHTVKARADFLSEDKTLQALQDELGTWARLYQDTSRALAHAETTAPSSHYQPLPQPRNPLEATFEREVLRFARDPNFRQGDKGQKNLAKLSWVIDMLLMPKDVSDSQRFLLQKHKDGIQTRLAGEKPELAQLVKEPPTLTNSIELELELLSLRAMSQVLETTSEPSENTKAYFLAHLNVVETHLNSQDKPGLPRQSDENLKACQRTRDKIAPQSPPPRQGKHV